MSLFALWQCPGRKTKLSCSSTLTLGLSLCRIIAHAHLGAPLLTGLRLLSSHTAVFPEIKMPPGSSQTAGSPQSAFLLTGDRGRDTLVKGDPSPY